AADCASVFIAPLTFSIASDAESNAEIAELTCAGADFVAISIPVAISASEAIEKVNGAMKTLAQSAANKETA
ncbi:MAG: hypothetical protein AAFW82_05610, partial [Pseudomonadota bacterium]